jgi:hypothetical protein
MAKVIGFTIKNQWINFSLYFVNFMYKTKRNTSKSYMCTHIIPDKQEGRLKGNDDPIGGGQKNTYFLGRGDTFQTDFIEVNKEDFVNIFFSKKINDISQLGIKIDKNQLKGTYKRDDTAFNTNQESNYNDPNQYYFLKGTNNNDIIQYLINSKIV